MPSISRRLVPSANSFREAICASGTSISFAGEDDAYALPAIEALLGRKINCEQPPAELLAPVPRKH